MDLSILWVLFRRWLWIKCMLVMGAPSCWSATVIVCPFSILRAQITLICLRMQRKALYKAQNLTPFLSNNESVVRSGYLSAQPCAFLGLVYFWNAQNKKFMGHGLVACDCGNGVCGRLQQRFAAQHDRIWGCWIRQTPSSPGIDWKLWRNQMHRKRNGWADASRWNANQYAFLSTSIQRNQTTGDWSTSAKTLASCTLYTDE